MVCSLFILGLGGGLEHRAKANVLLILADGALGGTAQKIGGPLDKSGMVGQHFNADGKIGGMVQQNLAEKK